MIVAYGKLKLLHSLTSWASMLSQGFSTWVQCLPRTAEPHEWRTTCDELTSTTGNQCIPIQACFWNLPWIAAIEQGGPLTTLETLERENKVGNCTFQNSDLYLHQFMFADEKLFLILLREKCAALINFFAQQFLAHESELMVHLRVCFVVDSSWQDW